MRNGKGWIGVDLDGTLAKDTDWEGPEIIGEPVPAMLARVKQWLADGEEVRIFTARVSPVNRQDALRARGAISLWCKTHIGEVLLITCMKDRHMKALWDDRAVAIEKNTGKILGGRKEIM